MSSGPEFDRLWPSAQPTPFRGSVKPRCYLFPSKIRNANLAHQRLAVALADDFLDEPDKRTPQFGVADLRERSDQFQSVGVGEKVGDVRGRRSRCALPDVARDLGSAFEEERHRYLQNVGHRLQPASADAVCAFLVFLNLLECYPEFVAERFLAHV